MTNTLAIWIALLIAAFLALDYFVLHLNVPIIAMQQLFILIDLVAFWR